MEIISTGDGVAVVFGKSDVISVVTNSIMMKVVATLLLFDGLLCTRFPSFLNFSMLSFVVLKM
jgi:hypothetical protein